jgi:glycine betaine/proline transport system permease protein
LVRLAARLIIEEALEGEAEDALGRGHYARGAATASGATRWQQLYQVQIPLALPEIMLGLNQTIMMGLSMVIVAALAGARGLGQDIMIALTWLDVGNGLVAGLCVAAIAISTDRIIQAWSNRKKAELGLAHSI